MHRISADSLHSSDVIEIQMSQFKAGTGTDQILCTAQGDRSPDVMVKGIHEL